MWKKMSVHFKRLQILYMPYLITKSLFFVLVNRNYTDFIKLHQQQQQKDVYGSDV